MDKISTCSINFYDKSNLMLFLVISFVSVFILYKIVKRKRLK